MCLFKVVIVKRWVFRCLWEAVIILEVVISEMREFHRNENFVKMILQNMQG